MKEVEFTSLVLIDGKVNAGWECTLGANSTTISCFLAELSGMALSYGDTNEEMKMLFSCEH